MDVKKFDYTLWTLEWIGWDRYSKICCPGIECDVIKSDHYLAEAQWDQCVIHHHLWIYGNLFLKCLDDENGKDPHKG